MQSQLVSKLQNGSSVTQSQSTLTLIRRALNRLICIDRAKLELCAIGVIS